MINVSLLFFFFSKFYCILFGEVVARVEGVYSGRGKSLYTLKVIEVMTCMTSPEPGVANQNYFWYGIVLALVREGVSVRHCGMTKYLRFLWTYWE